MVQTIVKTLLDDKEAKGMDDWNFIWIAKFQLSLRDRIKL